MAVMTQLQLEGSSTVYDINDARISATSVATATHFLATNSGVSAINPISAADLASVLGAGVLLYCGVPSGYVRFRIAQNGIGTAGSGALKVIGMNNYAAEDVVCNYGDNVVKYIKIYGSTHAIKDVYYVVNSSSKDIYFHHNSTKLYVYCIGVAEFVEEVSTLPSGAIAADAL